MILEDIGFYTLSDARVKQVDVGSPFWRCELLLTDACNFKCPYCRGVDKTVTLSYQQAERVVDLWAAEGLKNIRFSGGEPTLWKGLEDLVWRAKFKGIERIALSTNGSATADMYKKLLVAGVSDFSISLDACCAETGDAMAGNKRGSWEIVTNNIRELAKRTYVTVGVVLTESNVQEFYDIIAFASDDLKVADIRIVTSAQWNEMLRDVHVPQKYLDRHPILRYRMGNFNSGRHVRGLQDTDSKSCALALDDMAVRNGQHFPCIIHLREGGAAIGPADETMRTARINWFTQHDTHADPICKKNCLDVCIDYNNKYRAMHDFNDG